METGTPCAASMVKERVYKPDRRTAIRKIVKTSKIIIFYVNIHLIEAQIPLILNIKTSPAKIVTR
jgi:hypothetical protein